MLTVPFDLFYALSGRICFEMGTLTANAPRLDEQCQHKLPTSCRLTATPDCCACQDRRSHAPTYSTYVDGVGMVSRGTRWQRYCWFCKQFWENRIALEGLDPKSTRVPEFPDQSSFCRAWYEYQKGFRNLAGTDDGDEDVEPLTCEIPWRDTPPGYLPLRHQPGQSSSHPVPTAPVLPIQPHVSIEEALDAMSDDEDPSETSNQANAAHEASQQLLPQLHADPAAQRNVLPSEQQIQEAQSRLDEALARKRRIADELHNAETELRVCREQHRQVSTAQQRMRNFERVFGSREEVRQQGEAYQSPLSAMFQRAYGWHQTAEEVRAAERDSNQQERDYEHLLSAVQEPWLRRTLASVRQQVVEEAEASTSPRSLDDNRIQRPPPKTDAEMNVSLSCRICLQQMSDTAVLPCGHLIMCSYCAEIAMPTRDEAQVIPARRDAKCLLCRKSVKRMAKIYLS